MNRLRSTLQMVHLNLWFYFYKFRYWKTHNIFAIFDGNRCITIARRSKTQLPKNMFYMDCKRFAIEVEKSFF